MEEGSSKNGVYVDDIAKETVEKIVDEGTITEDGSNDVLTQALGTRERSGRVRGVGSLVTPTSYFNTSRPNSSSHQVSMKQINNLQNYVMTLVSIMQKQGLEVPGYCHISSQNADKLGFSNERPNVVGPVSTKKSLSPQMSVHNRGQNDIDSNHSPVILEKEKETQELVQGGRSSSNSSSDNMKRLQCWLALGAIDRIVAKAHLHDTDASSILHGVPLGEGNA